MLEYAYALCSLSQKDGIYMHNIVLEQDIRFFFSNNNILKKKENLRAGS